MIGIMSGTSLDGADAVLARFGGAGGFEILEHVHAPFAAPLRAELLSLQAPTLNELERAALAANSLADHYTALVARLLKASGLSPTRIAAIGAHGQTIRHQPERGFTIQLNSPARIAERTGIDVIADFRSRDVAAGGQGAPLVPAFHAAVFGHAHEHRAVVNLGGMSNITDLPPAGSGGQVRGWDCGPGNVLLDEWAGSHLGRAFDAGGSWAATGTVQPALLARLLSESWLSQSPPKSTGRDQFHRRWLEQCLEDFAHQAAADIQATLAEFTAACVVSELEKNATGVARLVICGGGAANHDLVGRIARRCAMLTQPILSVARSDELGVEADQVEALAFAWLAAQFLMRRPGNLPAVTGASGLRVLGALYPAQIASSE